MGAVSPATLAAAVANAGAVGSITIMGLSATTLDRVLEDVLGRTRGVIAANVLGSAIDLEAVELAASRLPLVDFFWSDPDPNVIELVHRHGAKVSWQIGSVEEARAAIESGADVVVVQGIEAGGHVRAMAPLLALLPAVLDLLDSLGAASVPVLAAGGIGHPRALAAVLAAGAAGARVGTALIATEESAAHPVYKQALVDAGPGDSTVTDTFSVGCPLCATSPRHRVLRRCIDACHTLPDGVHGETQVGSRRIPLPKGAPFPPATSTSGPIEAMALYASDAAAATTAVRPAADVVTWLCDGADQLLTAATTPT